MKKQMVLKIVFLAILVGVTFTIISINFQKDEIQIESITSDGIPRAAIIDQLHNDKPNQDFQKNVTNFLSTAGYHVDLFTTDDITVDFYKKLPSMNYEFIVIRSHSLGDGTVEESASLFTGEIYRKDRYIDEQYSGQVGKGLPYLPEEVEGLGGWEALRDETYFVVGSKLVDELMVGTFPNSVIVLGGCETTEGTILADSLLQRGASEIIGWNGLVSSKDNDKIILKLLEDTLVNDMEIQQAVQSVMQEYVDKLAPPATLKYYSSGASDSNG
jgi:hypothetical protein